MLVEPRLVSFLKHLCSFPLILFSFFQLSIQTLFNYIPLHGQIETPNNACP